MSRRQFAGVAPPASAVRIALEALIVAALVPILLPMAQRHAMIGWAVIATAILLLRPWE